MLRLLAFGIDWLLIVLWGGLLFAVSMLATGGDPPRFDEPWRAQAIGFVAMTLPVTLYFAACESSPWQATIGKRIVGLVVSRQNGARLSVARALLRNAIKFAPWEFGHTVVAHAALSADGTFPAWLWGPASISMIGPVWWLLALFTSGRTPYDRWADVRIARGRTSAPSVTDDPPR